MELAGSRRINAPAQVIWDMLMNPETLAKVTPGISTLELESEGVYKAIADVKMGPVNGRFEGKAEVIAPIAPQSFTLKVTQNSKIGNVSADIRMNLVEMPNNQTELSFEGKADMSGVLARTGNRVMSGVANTLTKQFFDSFESELAAMPTPTLDTQLTSSTINETPKHIEQVEPLGLFQRIIRWFKSLFR